MFIWDVAKAATNYTKHLIAFDEAITVFYDSEGLDWHDIKHPDVEHRREKSRTCENGYILIVIYTVRRINEKETIRIISARQASRKERKAYFG